MNYNSYRSYLTNKFGGPVLKIPLNAGFSCPNRDGTIGKEGCSFCDNRSFSPRALDARKPLEQLREAIRSSKKRSQKVVAYLQPFTNTYGTVEELKSIYEPIIAEPGVVGLALGTRPDCFAHGVFDYLADVASRTYLSVELGLQSANEEALALSCRGHGLPEFASSCRELHKRGIETVAHVMLGLPGDTPELMLHTGRVVAALPVTGVKIHQLMIIAGTRIEDEYKRGEIQALSLDAYAKLLGDFLAVLRPDQHIHRLIGDSRPEFGLVAPGWCKDKMTALNYINKYFSEHNVQQGSAFQD